MPERISTSERCGCSVFRYILALARLAAPGRKLSAVGVALLLGTLFSGACRASLDPDKSISQAILQTWETAQGLPQNTVLSSAQTDDGYLWLGTEEGLVRFDGLRFTVFNRRTAGIQDDMVRALLVDHNQDLWIGTNGGGLSCLHRGHMTNYHSGLPRQSILSLLEDKTGAIWAGTDGGGLVRFEGGKFHVYTKADGLPDNSVFALSKDADGNLYIGTHEGLRTFKGGKFVDLPAWQALDKEYIRTIHVCRHGDFWVGTNDGLYRLRGKSVERFTTKDGLASNTIDTLYEDKIGSLWIGTQGGGLSRLANGKFSSFTEKDGLLGKDVWTVLEDREGSLWVGTGGSGGLNCLKKGSFTTLSKREGLPSDMILTTFQDSEGSLWIGSDQGLARLKNGRVTAFTTRQGLPDNFVFTVTETKEHEIWIGTRHGLARLKNDRIKVETGNSFLAGSFITCAYTDRKGNIWLGTRGGLAEFGGDHFRTYTTRDGLSSNYVLALYEDARGTLWIGTGGGGLNALEDGKFRVYRSRDGLSNEVIWALNGDGDGTIWLGTSGGGLDRLRGEKFTAYTSANGLYDDAPLAILDDHLGHLWISSNKGVFSLEKEQLNALAEGRLHNITSTVYGPTDGLRSRECNGGFQPAGWRTKDGRLLFATTKGLATVDPAHLVTTQVPPHVVIERVLADNKEAKLDEPLVVPPGKGQLEIQFTAPMFVAPEKLQFRYMLEGFDKDWTQAGNRRVAYYTNIPHGEYRFLVRAGSGDLWSTDTGSALMTLEPHYYQTKPFLIFIVIAGVSLCALAYRIRVSQLKIRERKLLILVNERTSALQESETQLRRSRDELEHRVEERTRELVDTNKALGDEVSTRRRTEEQLILAKDAAEAASHAKSDFLANMSHEIRTPINGILGMTDITLSTDLNEEQKEYLEIVKFSADSLLGIVNDILDFSKIEARKLTLDHAPFHLRKTVAELVKSLSLRARQKSLFLTCDVANDVPDQVLGDPLRLRQVLLNLLDNALKFTSTGGVSLTVWVESQSERDARLHFAVTDTGIGIAPDKQRTIFEAFSQADTSSTRRYGGTGLGLTISYQLAAMMDGRLWVESEPNQGSTFHFTARLDLELDPSSAGVQQFPEGADVLQVY